MSRLGIFDSGIGGLTTYLDIRKRTGVDIVYLADDLHSPYGDKSRGELYHCAIRSVDTLTLYGCDAIVIACNTITSTLKPQLVSRYPEVKFVGTEPALLPADRVVRGDGKIALMCTPATASSDRLRALISECVSTVDVYAMDGLASYIERYVYEEDMLCEYISHLTPWLSRYRALVLGCTHYVYLKDILRGLYPNLLIFDGNEGVANRVSDMVGGGRGCTIYLTTSGREGSYMRRIVDNYQRF